MIQNQQWYAFGPNPNASWYSKKRTWFLYVAALLWTRLALNPFFESSGAWTMTNLLHACFSTYFLHWVKVLPYPLSSPKDASLTIWEQIDNEKHYTPTKKFFILLPLVLFLISLQANQFNLWEFFWNTLALLMSVLPTLPAFHRFRPFGINDGLDDWR